MLGLTAIAGPADAHPHAWIDLTVTAETDGSGHVTALRQVWRFDEFYTIFVLQDTAPGGGPPDDVWLDELMNENIRNLTPYDYFTEVEDPAGPVPFAGVSDVDGRMVGDRLELVFTLHLDRPADAVTGPVVYRVFDPSYYVQILHKDGAAGISVDPPGACDIRLIEPDPDPDAYLLAATADIDPSVTESLGRLFAEDVELRCGSNP